MAAPRMTRRALFGLLAAAGAAAALRFSFGRGDGFDELIGGTDVRREEGGRFTAPLLASAYSTRMSTEFGRLYLEQRRGGRAEPETLAAEVMARLEASRPWRDTSPALASEELDRRLAEAIAADFLEPRGVCEIDGWYLSQTECRLAAMRYLASL